MGYAFISYSTKNQAMADAIRNTFTANKIDTWMAPYSIPPGSKYAQSITNAIRNCSCFVLLLSNASQASEAVDSEVELAALTFKKSIVTVQIENVVLNDAFTFYIHNKQILPLDRVDVSTPAMQAVLSTVISFAGQTLKTAQPSNNTYAGAQPTSPPRPVNGGSSTYTQRPSQGTPPQRPASPPYANGYASGQQRPPISNTTPHYQNNPQTGAMRYIAQPQKSKIVAGLLAILLGFIGAHNFYLKRNLLGVLSVVFCWTYIPSIASFVEGIMILCMDDQAFNTKYNK